MGSPTIVLLHVAFAQPHIVAGAIHAAVMAWAKNPDRLLMGVV